MNYQATFERSTPVQIASPGGACGALELLVYAVTWEALGIYSWELRDPMGMPLPPFTAGAHIDVYLPNGMTRSYSLVNPQSEPHRYVIAVQKDSNSRGGSKCLHEMVHTGDRIRVGLPRNNFELNEEAPHTLMIAGGIGITPIWCMTQRLIQLGRPWELHYCVRTRERAAFVEPILQAGISDRVHLNFDGAQGGKMLNLEDVVAAAPRGTHFYCCGPMPMLTAFERALDGYPIANVHVEYFAAKQEAATHSQYVVQLARNGAEVNVLEGKTILETLLEAGYSVPNSCREGVCGACETTVLEGTPDHRDSILTQSERQSGKTMMICCSGAKTSRLVLDI